MSGTDLEAASNAPHAASTGATKVVATSAPTSRLWRRFRRQRLAMVAVIYLAVLIAVAVFAPLLTPHDPNAQSLANALLPIGSPDHLLGTDHFGRDTFSRLIAGTSVAVFATAQAVATAVVLGVAPGILAGLAGGWIDASLMRLNDALMSFPPLLLAIGIVGTLGVGLQNAMIAIGIVFAPTFLRIARASVLEVREETYFEASRSIGTPMWWVIRRHVLPNILPPLLVQTSLAGAFALLSEAGLSFLGLGVQPPEASWGLMLSNGYTYLAQAPELVVLPGIAIAATVLAFNLLGDGLRDSIGRETRTG